MPTNQHKTHIIYAFEKMFDNRKISCRIKMYDGFVATKIYLSINKKFEIFSKVMPNISTKSCKVKQTPIAHRICTLKLYLTKTSLTETRLRMKQT